MVTKEEIEAVFTGAKVNNQEYADAWSIYWAYNGHETSGFIDADYIAWFSHLDDKFTYEPYFNNDMTLEELHKQITSDIDKWDYAFA
ncbi:MAG: hypothetical protein E7B29_11910 [Mixta calida]|nr:hypothetical protein [Mixta calida]